MTQPRTQPRWRLSWERTTFGYSWTLYELGESSTPPIRIGATLFSFTRAGMCRRARRKMKSPVTGSICFPGESDTEY